MPSDAKPHVAAQGKSEVSPPAVLVVDDDAAVCWAIERALAAQGWRVLVAAHAAAARRLASQADVVLTDVRMPGCDGLDLLGELRRTHPRLPVVVMTAHGTLDTAVAAVARGAFDYLTKPLDLAALQAVLARAAGEAPLAAAARPAAGFAGPDVIGASPPMQALYRRLAAAAAVPVAVLFTGPAGVGKELLARWLHRQGGSCERPFVRVPCAVLGERAAEEVGAQLAAAQGGSLFLDEVETLSPAAQEALLAAIRAGSGCRLISAARRDLVQLAAAGAWHAELAASLATLHIAVPPLAARVDDIPALARAFLARAAARLGRELAITERALARLCRHAWPGNVRELRQVLDEAAVLAVGGVIDVEHLGALGAEERPLAPAALAAWARHLLDACPGRAHEAALAELEAALVREALARSGGNQLRAAELLGINRTTLKKRMDAAGIAP